MPRFYDLKDVYIIFIQQMRYKNSHKQKVHEYKDTLQSTPVITVPSGPPFGVRNSGVRENFYFRPYLQKRATYPLCTVVLLST